LFTLTIDYNKYYCYCRYYTLHFKCYSNCWFISVVGSVPLDLRWLFAVMELCVLHWYLVPTFILFCLFFRCGLSCHAYLRSCLFCALDTSACNLQSGFSCTFGFLIVPTNFMFSTRWTSVIYIIIWYVSFGHFLLRLLIIIIFAGGSFFLYILIVIGEQHVVRFAWFGCSCIVVCRLWFNFVVVCLAVSMWVCQINLLFLL